MNSGAEESDRVLIGRVAGTHALKGVLRVHPYAESESVFGAGRPVAVHTPGGARLPFEIRWSRPHGNVRLVCLDGIGHIDEARALVGSELSVDRSSLPELEEGTYYWRDLIGLSVFDAAGYVGRIEAVFPTGSNDVYVVSSGEGDSRREVMIPAIASVVLEIDLERKIMRVALPEGLIEDGSAR